MPFTQEQVTSSLRLVIGYAFTILATLGWLPDFMGDAFQQQVIAMIVPVVHVVYSIWNARAAAQVKKAGSIDGVHVEVSKTAEPKLAEAVVGNPGVTVK